MSTYQCSVCFCIYFLEVIEKEHKCDLSVSTQVHSSGKFCSPGQEIFRNSARNFWSMVKLACARVLHFLELNKPKSYYRGKWEQVKIYYKHRKNRCAINSSSNHAILVLRSCCVVCAVRAKNKDMVKSLHPEYET